MACNQVARFIFGIAYQVCLFIKFTNLSIRGDSGNFLVSHLHYQMEWIENWSLSHYTDVGYVKT